MTETAMASDKEDKEDKEDGTQTIGRPLVPDELLSLVRKLWKKGKSWDQILHDLSEEWQPDTIKKVMRKFGIKEPELKTTPEDYTP